MSFPLRQQKLSKEKVIKERLPTLIIKFSTWHSLPSNSIVNAGSLFLLLS